MIQTPYDHMQTHFIYHTINIKKQWEFDNLGNKIRNWNIYEVGNMKPRNKILMGIQGSNRLVGLKPISLLCDSLLWKTHSLGTCTSTTWLTIRIVVRKWRVLSKTLHPWSTASPLLCLFCSTPPNCAWKFEATPNNS